MDWDCVDYWDVFFQLFGLSLWRHPFTAEGPLVSKWCNAKFLQICSHEETNSSTFWMAWGWVNFQQISIFGWTILLKIQYVLWHIKCNKINTCIFFFYLFFFLFFFFGLSVAQITHVSTYAWLYYHHSQPFFFFFSFFFFIKYIYLFIYFFNLLFFFLIFFIFLY